MQQATIQYANTGITAPFEKVLSMLPDAIIIIDRNYIIEFINASARDIIENQLQSQVETGDPFLSILPEERHKPATELIELAFSNQPSIACIDYGQRGIDCWLELGYYPLTDENGLVTHVCLQAKNVTEKINLEAQIETERKIQKNQLIRAAYEAQERQRSEIGRELHDNVNQVLTTVKLYNEICLTEETTNKAMLMKSVQQINFCIETLRALSKVLGSPSIEEVSLKESVRELVNSFVETRKIHVNFFTYHVHDEKISQDLQTAIYRIAQEQLTNVLKYANASSVDVFLVGTAESIALRIQDDGNGFDMNHKRKGVGITNMISRAESLDGKIELQSTPGGGCTLMVEFPLTS